jgi:predicted nucleotide-binding protein
LKVEVARSAEQALDIDLAGFEGAIVDLMLPNDVAKSGISEAESRGGFLTGVAVARRLLQKKPDIHITMISSDIASAQARAWAKENAVSFVSKEDGCNSLLQALKRAGHIKGERAPLAFIVHGHDSSPVSELKNFLQNTLKWQEPIVLREQQSLGKTIIEKFEEYAGRIDCVFVLLTPDDKVSDNGSDDERRRSRQNVIFELGFFYGTLERGSGRVLLLHKGRVELPSDISGIIWIDISNGIQSAGEEIRKEVMSLLPPAVAT